MIDVISDFTSCAFIHDILDIIDSVISNSNPDLTVKITFLVAMTTVWLPWKPMP